MSEASGVRPTVVETIVIVAIVLIAAILIMPLLGEIYGPRRNSRIASNTTLVRGITQSVVVYGGGNKEFYPGLDSKGEVVDATVEHRFWLLLNGNYFSGEYLISPAETKTVWTTGSLDSSQYSYAMLQLNLSEGQPKTGRISEWRQMINSEAIILSDRNTGSDADANVQSIHSVSPGFWHGAVGRNDGSAYFENTHVLDTRYGPKGLINIDDNIFEAIGDDDAYMIHTGN